MNRKMRNVVSVPKRFSELIALVSVSTTVFLFFHTQMLTARIEEIQGVLTAAGSSAHENQLTQHAEEQTPSNPIQVRGPAPSFVLPNMKYNATSLNNTRNAVKETLFFNRVPKVGPQTIMDLIQRLSNRNGFQFHRDGTQKVETIKLTYYEESRLATMIDMFTPPSSYVKHTCFSNFTRHGYPMPIYVNIVRDPIERVISWFYYIRAPWYIIERKQAFPELPLPHPQWLKKDFETCVQEIGSVCSFLGSITTALATTEGRQCFSVGMMKDALLREFNGEWAMQQAKRNVEKHYAVVGVLEEMDTTLSVLENYIPRFFNGATQVYYDNLAIMKKINRNMYKPPVSQEVKDILRKNFTKEIEFYEFCKQRLHKQYVALLENNNE